MAQLLHPVRAIGDAVRHLQLPHVLHDSRERRLPHLGLWRHIAVRPVVLAHPDLGRDKEGAIRMMAGIVDVMDERWTLVGAGGIAPVTGTGERGNAWTFVFPLRRAER
jgi:hypothetical protein